MKYTTTAKEDDENMEKYETENRGGLKNIYIEIYIKVAVSYVSCITNNRQQKQTNTQK